MNPFTTRRHGSVAALGERRLIQHIRRWLGDVTPAAPFGIGDDCAVIPPTRRHQLVTTDPVIHGRHFDDTVPPRAVGAKLLKRNLSDIAAMGGRPVAAVVSLALAPETDIAWLRGFYLGLAATARKFRVKIVGGDVTQAPAGFFGAFLALHGESTGSRVIPRTGARAGDHVLVTGRLGGSLRGHHFRFTPRLAEGAWLAARPEVVAMMDVSDGLANDLEALTTDGLAAALRAEAVPVSSAARQLARRSGRTPLAHALGDGEDYELLVVVRARTNLERLRRDWRRRFPHLTLSLVGNFTARNRLPADAVDLAAYRGYEHLR
ncbi:MAG: thiamine-phosphate kinase [Verrucomicrobiota bacterium]